MSTGTAGSAKVGSEVIGGMTIIRVSAEHSTRTRYNTQNGDMNETHDAVAITHIILPRHQCVSQNYLGYDNFSHLELPPNS